MIIPIPDRRANDNEMGEEASLTNGFGSFIPAESPWRRVVRSWDCSQCFFSIKAAAATVDQCRREVLAVFFLASLFAVGSKMIRSYNCQSETCGLRS